LQAIPQAAVVQVALPLGTPEQTWSHMPQFCVSESSLMQAPWHGLYPGLHWMSQPEVTQVAWPLAGAGQAMPQALQLAGSLVRSMHEPLQLVVPLGHELWHLPPAQTVLAPQGVSQPPQCPELVSVLTHAPPH
jgi:hypothetical protein